MIYKGQNLRVAIGGQVVAAATSCTIHVALQTEDTSTKDSDCDWAESEPVGKNWDVKTDSLFTLEDSASGKTSVDLLGLVVNGTKAVLSFDTYSGTGNRTAGASGVRRYGYAFLTDFSLTAGNRQKATLSASFTGTGALGTTALS